MPRIVIWLLALTSGLKQTAQAVNAAKTADELTERIKEQINR